MEFPHPFPHEGNPNPFFPHDKFLQWKILQRNPLTRPPFNMKKSPWKRLYTYH